MLKFVIFCSLSLVVFCQPSEPAKPDEYICGISPAHEKYGTHNVDKLLEGNVSRPGDWPWLVSLYVEGNFHCTSTLISDKWILTAAHCVMGFTNLSAFAGSNKLYDGQELVVQKSIYHPLFLNSPIALSHDIGLIQVSNVTFSEKVKPVCLSSKLSKSPRNNSIAVGWGVRIVGNELVGTEVLCEDYIPIEPQKHCDFFNRTFGYDSKTEICAGKEKHSVYFGDSGGPLMEVVNNRFYEIGITSRSAPNEAPQSKIDFEDIFTYVPAYCDWITESTNGDVKCE